MKHVEGRNVGNIVLYALSTCIWCRKTKELLDELNIDYHYVYVDLLDEDEKNKIKEEISKWNPDCSFPTLVKDNKFCITGYNPVEIKKRIK
ncbi:MAG: glutaredoxin family protein [Elusimicrobia bacterium]|nr:glutaredoxin family protein [Elusimicrobiota bacterium]